jgi:hypothetical protein
MQSGTSSESLNRHEQPIALKRSLTVEINAIKPAFLFSTEHDADDEEDYVFNNTEKITRSIPFQKRYRRSGHEVDETTALLPKYSKSQASSSPTRPQNYLNVVTEMESQQSKIRERKRFLRLMGSSFLLALALVSAAIFGFTSQPIQDPNVFGVEIETRSISLFEFNLNIVGLNSNLIPVVLTPDLDVYASRERPESYLFSKDFIANQELLGHVREFSSPAALPPISTSAISLKISMVDPSNTLGKFIYMTFPFVLTVKGSLTYSSPMNLFHYQIPVCLYQIVEFTGTQTFSC